MNYSTVSAGKSERNITVKWTTPDISKTGMEYVVSVKNSSHPSTWTTILDTRVLNMTVHDGIEYNITVISQRCNGTVRSNSSVLLHILFAG